jgi:hypothetical protein
MNKKLVGIPPIFCISLDKSENRRQKIVQNPVEINFKIFKEFHKNNYQLNGDLIHYLKEHSKGPVTSHLKINEYWIDETDYEYVMIIEDDLSFVTVDYWPFNWKNFFAYLPNDWDCIQLCMIRDQRLNIGIKFRERHAIDLGCQAYLIKRAYAKRLIDHYVKGNQFNLNVPEILINDKTDQLTNATDNFDESIWIHHKMIPIVENVMFLGFGNVYIIPLFVENISLQSNFGYDFENKKCHIDSYNYILDYWKKKGQYMTLRDLFI